MSSQFGKNFGLEALDLAKEAERKDIELWAITQRIQSAKLRRWVGRGGRWEVSLQDAIRLEEGSGNRGWETLAGISPLHLLPAGMPANCQVRQSRRNKRRQSVRFSP